ncbi:MAG: tetratricopeptide repeat protein, partial [Bacteroidota bacterium]
MDSTHSISTPTLADTIEVWDYIQSARKYRYTQPDSAQIFAENAKALSDEIGFPIGAVYALSNLGILARNRAETSLALDYFYQGLSVSQQIRNTEREAALSKNLGDAYLRAKGRGIDSVFHYLSHSLELYRQLEDEKGMMKVHLSLGNFYASLPDLEKAKGHFFQGLPYAEKLGYAPLFQENIGNIYIQKEALDSARIFYEKVLAAYGDNISINLQHNLAVLAQKQGEYLKAIQLYEDNLERKALFPNRDLWVSTLNNLAHVYSIQGKPDKALPY